MKKYQIMDCGAAFGHAGTKAAQDVAEIAQRMGFEECKLRMRTVKESKLAKLERQAGYFLDWKSCCSRIERDSLVLLQHPFHYPQLTREHCLLKLKKKNVRFLCVVHDVEELRGFRYTPYYKNEFQFMLKIADVLIVHNKVMRSFFRKRGVREEALVSLGIFDYLQRKPPKHLPGFSRRVIIAGNLDVKKSEYIRELWKLGDVSFELYGGHYDKSLDIYDNISYCGCFPADHPADYLTCGLGLVWDGDSLSKCVGESGEYLRYNNPHKLSLYLSCGLPVIIWEGAAEAAFVRENQVGICVESLWEMKDLLGKIDEKSYRVMAENAGRIGRRLLAGAYLETALKKAQSLIR